MYLRIKNNIYLAIYLILYCSLVQRYIWGNQLIQLLPDIIIAIICIFQKGLTNRIARKKSIKSILGNLIIYLYILFFILGIFSDLYNMVNPISAIWGIRMIIRYGLLFLLVYKNFNLYDLNIIRKIINHSFYINMFFILFQFITNERGDAMGGIWGGNGELAIYIILLTLLYSADFFYNKMSIKQYIFKISFFFMSSMWAEIKILYFVLPLCVYGTYVLIKKFTFKHIIILVSAFFLSIPILSQILSLYYDDDYVTQTLNTEELQKYNESSYGFTEESLNRGTIFKKSDLFLDSTIYKTIGHGLGNGTVSQYFSTDVFETYKNTFYYYFTTSYLLMEVGYTGLIIFIIIHIILLYKFYINYASSKDYILKYWSSLGMLSTIITFIIIYYNSIPLSNYYLGYLFWAICCIAINERKIQLKKLLHDS